MSSKAPRLPARLWRYWVRGALLASCLWLVETNWATAADTITTARFADPTTRYAHGVLGDNIEYGALELTINSAATRRVPDEKSLTKPTVLKVHLPSERVFEDLAPRLVDVDLDGTLEAIVVESDNRTGAQLAIYDARGVKVAATPHIGTRFRWLAPIGAADLDGDGFVEIAYIDRPHLAKTLRIWRFQDDDLTEIATFSGLTNHRIGEDFITGGLRDCGVSPELVVVSADWQKIVSVSYDQDWTKRTVAPFTSDTMEQVLNCSH